MPIYEYQCTGCHHKFDMLQKLNDEPTKECPQCSKNTAIRLVSAAGFQLKGSGWYATDFKNKGKIDQKPERESSSPESSSTEKKTTDQPATPSSDSSKGERD